MSGSDYTLTPNYSLIKPTPNADNDVWGDHLNFDLDTLDSLIKTVETKAGVSAFNTRTGSVSLTTVDVTTALPPAGAQPAMDGAGVPGVANTFSRGDHQHPTDTSRASVASLTAYAPIASPTFTGDPRAPTPTAGDNDTTIATTAFVQAAVGGVPGGAVIADTPPASAPGALWWDSTGGNLYVRYADANSTAWVTASNLTGLANAATKTEVAAAQNNVGRNLIHNALFNVAQRGAGVWNASGYTADRWQVVITLDTTSVSVSSAPDVVRTQIGDEAARNVLAINVAGNAGAAAFTEITHAVESVPRLAGKTVILSFWAVAATGTPKIGIGGYQFFGTGGSPSAPVNIAGGVGVSVTLNAVWTRYNVSIAIPSIVGKTLGTNPNTDHTTFQLWFSSGATNNIAAGSIGVQSNTFQLWGVQLEIAAGGQTQPSPLDHGGSPQQQLADCQRFFCVGAVALGGYSAASIGAACTAYLPVTMRAAPTITVTSNNDVALTSPTQGILNTQALVFQGATPVGGSGWYLSRVFTASADL